MNGKPNGMPPQGTSVKVDIGSAPTVKCAKCGNATFQEVAILKHISAITSPTGQAGYFPIPVFSCNACGHINKEFLPAPMQKEEEAKATEDGTTSSKIQLM